MTMLKKPNKLTINWLEMTEFQQPTSNPINNHDKAFFKNNFCIRSLDKFQLLFLD